MHLQHIGINSLSFDISMHDLAGIKKMKKSFAQVLTQVPQVNLFLCAHVQVLVKIKKLKMDVIPT